MANAIEPRVIGSYTSSYMDVKPEVALTFYGSLNDNKDNRNPIGYGGGRVGHAVIYGGELTFRDLTQNNPDYQFIIGVQNEVVDLSNNVFRMTVTNNTIRNYDIGSTRGAVGVNFDNHSLPSGQIGYFYYAEQSSQTAVRLGFNGTYDYGYFYQLKFTDNYTRVKTGKQDMFFIELRANCPVVRLVNGRFKDVNGNMVGLTAKTKVSDIDSEWLLTDFYEIPTPNITTYWLTNNFSSSEGSISKILRIWANNKLPIWGIYYSDLPNADAFVNLFNYDGVRIVSECTNEECKDVDVIDSDFNNFVFKTKENYYVEKFDTNIPFFDSQEKGEEFERLFKEEGSEAASDYANSESINPSFGGDTPKDDKGLSNIDKTELKDVGGNNVFNKLFAISSGAVSELSAMLFNTDTSIADALSEGLKMYGANPMDCIIDLSYYPFSLTSVYPYATQHSVSFGSYMTTFNADFNYISRPRAIFDFGRVFYPKINEDYRDLEPYSECYIVLPYIGSQKLNIASYYNKSIGLNYVIDLTTGSVEAVLYANDYIVDHFDGNIAVKQSISNIDYNAYAQSVRENTLNTLKSTATTLTAGLKGVGNASDIISGLGSFEKSLVAGYDNMNAQRITIKASASAGTGLCLPQYPYLILVTNESVRPSNEQATIGFPTNVGGLVRYFSGYLQCREVNLVSDCNEDEREEIISLLKGGIYI